MQLRKKKEMWGKQEKQNDTGRVGSWENCQKDTLIARSSVSPLPYVDHRVEFSLCSSLTLPSLLFRSRAFNPSDVFWKCYHLLT